MSDQILLLPGRAADRNLDPLPGGKAYVYEAGTTVPVIVDDKDGDALAWPVPADLDGYFPQLFADVVGGVRVVVTDADDVVQYELDPAPRVASAANSAADVTMEATSYAPAANVQDGFEALDEAFAAIESRTIIGGGLATGGGALNANRTITVAAATAEDAAAGTSTTVAMTPASVKAAIEALAPLGKWFRSSGQTITSGGLLTLPHGMGRGVKVISLRLICLTAQGGWAEGDEFFVNANSSFNENDRFTAVWGDETNIYVRFSNAEDVFMGGNKTTGAAFGASNVNWALRVLAWG